MRRLRVERFKLYILIVLVITSFIQVGILLSYQNEGLPTNFLWNILTSNDKKVSIDLGDYVKPYRITATEGYDEAHYIIDGNHPYFDKLWNEAAFYISSLLEDKNIEDKQIYSEEFWGEVVVKKSFIYEFKTKIDTSILASLLNVQNVSSQGFDGIYKIAILPRVDSNNNIGFYIYDGIKTYGFVLKYKSKGLSRDDYSNMLMSLEADTDTNGYVVMRELMGKDRTPYSIKPDVIIPYGSTLEEFDEIVCMVPEEIKNLHPTQSNDLESIATKVLGSDKERLTRVVEADNSIVFRNPSKSYKIHSDGLLEYKYLYQFNKSDKGKDIEALETALKFIGGKADLVKGADIYLSGIKDNEDGYYTITFDYKVNQRSVSFINYPVNSGKDSSLNNAITITANKKKVISCFWILKEFLVGRDKFEIRTYPLDLLEDTFIKYDYLNFSNFSVKDVSISYEAKYGTNDEKLRPVWLIESIDGKFYVVEMKKKKGD